MLIATINVGSHFAIINMIAKWGIKDNIEGDDLWILICEETLTMVEKVTRLITRRKKYTWENKS
jgi:hypothetical protein